MPPFLFDDISLSFNSPKYQFIILKELFIHLSLSPSKKQKTKTKVKGNGV